MRIAISLLSFRPGEIGGTETYLRHMMASLSRVKGDDDVILVGHQGNTDALDVPGVDKVIVEKSSREILLARVMEAFTPYRARFAEGVFDEIAPDVVYFPQQSIFPKRVAFPSVLLALDVQYLYLPQYFSWFNRLLRKRMHRYAMARADRIISISEFTKATLVERCGVDASKVEVIPFGFSADGVERAAQERVKGSYLYYPAATLPHKGHAVLLRTFAELRRGGDFDDKLVLTGMQTDLWPKLRRLIVELGIEEDVIHLGFVSYEQLRQMYEGAAAVVFPTEFEGFGLPVYEAVEAGTKVVCSRLAVFDEIGVPKAWQIDFSDPDQLRAALAQDGPTVLEAEPWSWEECTSKALHIIRKTAASGR